MGSIEVKVNFLKKLLVHDFVLLVGGSLASELYLWT